jgi:hypothetical protein
MLARIYKPSKSTMQSGRKMRDEWLLEFEPRSARLPDRLMGWPSSDDTQSQVVLHFESQEEAVAYAQKHGIPFQVIPAQERRRFIRAYADNFAYGRKEPWTH